MLHRPIDNLSQDIGMKDPNAPSLSDRLSNIEFSKYLPSKRTTLGLSLGIALTAATAVGSYKYGVPFSFGNAQQAQTTTQTTSYESNKPNKESSIKVEQAAPANEQTPRIPEGVSDSGKIDESIRAATQPLAAASTQQQPYATQTPAPAPTQTPPATTSAPTKQNLDTLVSCSDFTYDPSMLGTTQTCVGYLADKGTGWTHAMAQAGIPAEYINQSIRDTAAKNNLSGDKYEKLSIVTRDGKNYWSDCCSDGLADVVPLGVPLELVFNFEKKGNYATYNSTENTASTPIHCDDEKPVVAKPHVAEAAPSEYVVQAVQPQVRTVERIKIPRMQRERVDIVREPLTIDEIAYISGDTSYVRRIEGPQAALPPQTIVKNSYHSTNVPRSRAGEIEAQNAAITRDLAQRGGDLLIEDSFHVDYAASCPAESQISKRAVPGISDVVPYFDKNGCVIALHYPAQQQIPVNIRYVDDGRGVLWNGRVRGQPHGFSFRYDYRETTIQQVGGHHQRPLPQDNGCYYARCRFPDAQLGSFYVEGGYQSQHLARYNSAPINIQLPAFQSRPGIHGWSTLPRNIGPRVQGEYHYRDFQQTTTRGGGSYYNPFRHR